MTRRADPFDTAAVRNLDEIQEADPNAAPSRLGALVLASLGGACIVFAAVLLVRSHSRDKPADVDPLGDLVARTHPAGAKKDPGREGVGHEVTFPGLLSDGKNPTTALEAVRGGKPAGSAPALPFELPPGSPSTPPPAGD